MVSEKLNHEALRVTQSRAKSWGRGAVRYDIHVDGINVASSIVRPDYSLPYVAMRGSDLQVHQAYTGQGLGSFLLRFILYQYPETEFWTRPRPHYHCALNPEALILFYARRGFIHHSDGMMIRPAQFQGPIP